MRSRFDYIFSNHCIRLVSSSSAEAADHPARLGYIGSGWGWCGFVAVLVAYDLLRRTTCIGDPWGLGGPGFTTPITPASGNVMIPQCPIVKKPAVRARG
jgi:hypothetical protein